MSRYIRKTRDIWQVMTNYGYGWECEIEEFTRREANQRKKEYLENTHAAVRIVKRREKIQEGRV